MSLNLQPITWQEAVDFINRWHSTHKAPQGWKYGLAVNNGTDVLGVATVGRPVNRHLDDEKTLEVTRCAVRDDKPKSETKNVASKLYAAAWRAAKAMGYQRIISYTLKDIEEGTPLRAAGYEVLHQTPGKSWDSPKRPRVDQHPTVDKERWEQWTENREKIEVDA